MAKFTTLDDELYDYMVAHARQDDVLRRVHDEAQAMGDLAEMQVSPEQGALIGVLCRIAGARDALELGTFTGYSAICIARALNPGGRLIACELSEEFAEIASRNFEAAGVADRIEIRIGPAAETVSAIPEAEAFDFAFIDADKQTYPTYYDLVVPRVRSGGLIVIDNVFHGGRVVPGREDPNRIESTEAIRTTNDRVRDDDRVDTALVAVADGLILARKR
ncbi:MAG TPA: O-methyltransferase [Solirubrobacterales bacterium]|nr:O-methyltransferase [Solirubrobacterales bacterium]